jgi:hypothetical protein
LTPHGLVTRTTAADTRELAASLRDADRLELESTSDRPVEKTLLFGALTSDPCLTLRTHEGALLGILGVVPDGAGVGVVWMAGTPLIEENRVSFLRGGRDVLAHLDRRYDVLHNAVDARNEVHIRWLRWLGFSFLRTVDNVGPRGITVIEFARIKPSV